MGENRSASLVVPAEDEPFLKLAYERGYEHVATLTSDRLSLEDDHGDESQYAYLEQDGLALGLQEEDDDGDSRTYELSLNTLKGLRLETESYEADDDSTLGWRIALDVEPGGPGGIRIENAANDAVVFETPTPSTTGSR